MDFLWTTLFVIVGLVVSGFAGKLLARLFKSDEDTWPLWSMLPMTVLLVGGYLWNRHHVLESETAELIAPIFLDERRLLLHEKMTIGNENGDTTYSRFTLVDLDTGDRLARETLEGWFRCWLPAPERLWCDGPDGYEVRDPATLAPIASHEQLMAKNPSARTTRDNAFQRDGDVVVVTSDDGYRYAFDPVTMLAARTDGERRPAAKPGASGPAYRFDGQPRAHLVVGEVKSQATYLEPKLLEDHREHPLDLDGDAIVVHQSSLDEKAARLRFTRVRPDGSERWTHEDGPGKAVAHRQGDRLIVMVGTDQDGPGTYVLVMDAASGRVDRRIVPQ